MQISKTLELPCGAVIQNRLAKAAMSENMATSGHHPGENFVNAYSLWVEGKTGLLITGNIMVDSKHRGEPYNVVIEKGLDNHAALAKWADTSRDKPTQIWAQLNHPGKQTPNFLTKTPLAPSAIALDPPLNNVFNPPRELTHDEILDIIERFAHAAEVCKQAGFGGVQIHGAHGYLVSQFLSPKHNRRKDIWGGSPEKRMHFVLEVYKAIRKKVGDQFPIGIKINSADFSKGGFSAEDAIEVAKVLSETGIDLIEISGGSYEKPVMMDNNKKDSTKKREAFFLQYAAEIKKVVKCPIMVTGGFRTVACMEEALQQGELDLIGLARPLALNPFFSKELLAGKPVESLVRPLTSGVKILDKIFPLEILWYTMQIRRMGKKLLPDPDAGVYGTMLKTIVEMGAHGFKRSRA